jgi:hypothetical protein
VTHPGLSAFAQETPVPRLKGGSTGMFCKFEAVLLNPFRGFRIGRCDQSVQSAPGSLLANSASSSSRDICGGSSYVRLFGTSAILTGDNKAIAFKTPVGVGECNRDVSTTMSVHVFLRVTF